MKDRETEAKFLRSDVPAVREKLSSHRFELLEPDHELRRKIFLFPNTQENKWGRVRAEHDRTTMAIKHVEARSIDGVGEVEMEVPDFDVACRFMLACGLIEVSYQENRREKWSSGEIVVTIDTWPGLESFVEIEASSESKVREAATVLGLDFSQAFFGGVDVVYEALLGIPTTSFNQRALVTFDDPPTRSINS